MLAYILIFAFASLGSGLILHQDNQIFANSTTAKLDEFIAKEATRILQNKLTFPQGIAKLESNGFFDESDELWLVREKRHANQIAAQEALMTTCPAGVWHSECLVGCKGEKADCPAHYFWQTQYEPSFSCVGEERIGLQGEGGKWVCDPYKLKDRKKDCLVYSIGSHGQYDFELAVQKQIAADCEIHIVDRADWSTYTKTPPPQGMQYHVRTIGVAPNTPINSLVKELGHTGRQIDIFKIDCEGCEWSTFKSWFGENVNIHQILVEVHGTGGGRGAHDFFKFLFGLGYVIFHKEPNTLGCRGKCLEYALVKLSPEFAGGKAHAHPGR